MHALSKSLFCGVLPKKKTSEEFHERENEASFVALSFRAK